MTIAPEASEDLRAIADRPRADSDYVFYELTRSICPNCRRVIDAQILLRDNKVYMRKRCPRLRAVRGARLRRRQGLHRSFGKFNKPGTIPAGVRHRDRARLPARLRPVPRPSAACLPGHHRGQQRLQHGLPALLCRRGARAST